MGAERPEPGARKGRTRRSPRHEASRHNAPKGTEWLSIEDLCDELSVPLSTAYKWSSLGPESGKFPRFCRLPNGKIRIRRDWLEEWLNELPQV
jgi:hypothetical protein